jgi:hypothetical protein
MHSLGRLGKLPAMPLYRFHIETRLSPPAAMARIMGMVGLPRSSSVEGLGPGDDASPPFVGKVEGDVFRIRRDIRYRNAFLPVIRGRITSLPMGARVSVTVRLPPAVALFMSAWFAGLVAGVASLSEPMHPLLVIPAGLFLFGAGLVCGGFFTEALKARRLLEQGLADPAGVDTSQATRFLA